MTDVEIVNPPAGPWYFSDHGEFCRCEGCAALNDREEDA